MLSLRSRFALLCVIYTRSRKNIYTQKRWRTRERRDVGKKRRHPERFYSFTRSLRLRTRAVVLDVVVSLFSLFFFLLSRDAFFDPLERLWALGGFWIFWFAVDVVVLYVFRAAVGVGRDGAVVPMPTAGFVKSPFFEHLLERGTVDASLFEFAVRVRLGFGDEVRWIIVNRMDLFRIKTEPFAAFIGFRILVDLLHVQSVLRPRASDVVSIRDAVFIPVGFA